MTSSTVFSASLDSWPSSSYLASENLENFCLDDFSGLYIWFDRNWLRLGWTAEQRWRCLQKESKRAWNPWPLANLRFGIGILLLNTLCLVIGFKIDLDNFLRAYLDQRWACMSCQNSFWNAQIILRYISWPRVKNKTSANKTEGKNLKPQPALYGREKNKLPSTRYTLEEKLLNL